jgi:hypothetical protein
MGAEPELAPQRVVNFAAAGFHRRRRSIHSTAGRLQRNWQRITGKQHRPLREERRGVEAHPVEDIDRDVIRGGHGARAADGVMRDAAASASLGT